MFPLPNPIYPPTYPPIHPSVHLPSQPSAHSSTHTHSPNHLPIHLSIHPHIHLPTQPLTPPSISNHLSIHLPTHPSTHILTHPLTHPSINIHLSIQLGFPGGSVVKNPPAKQEAWVQSLGPEDSLEEEMATQSSILAWEIPWVEEPSRLQPMGSQRVRYDLVTIQ